MRNCLCGMAIFIAINFLCLKIFNGGLKQYYCLQPADLLIIGHSMSEMAVDRNRLEQLTGMTVAKYCMNGTGIPDRIVMIRHYLEATHHKPAFILYDIGPRSFSGGLSVNSHALFYPFMDESPTVSQYVRSNATPMEYWQKKFCPLTRYEDTRLGAVVRGYRHDWKTRSVKRFNPDVLKHDIACGNFWKAELNAERQAAFEETLDFIRDQNIQLILLNLPNVDLLNAADSEQASEVLKYITQTAAKYPNVTYLDFNPPFQSRYELFCDPLHLNPQGQQEVTAHLAAELSALNFPSENSR